VPLLHGKPVILLLGAPSRRDARLLTGAVGLQGTYRVHTGALGADVLAAAARCADIFIMPAGARRLADADALLLTLTASGVPLVVGGGVRSETLEHERNAFLANAEDAMSLVTLLNSLLALPAVQRHYLGEEFAAYTLERWSWEQAIGAYAARFASLVGRPQIPAELRAA
jgi:glycosyltransferase involved in cell wall biosynthesis